MKKFILVSCALAILVIPVLSSAETGLGLGGATSINVGGRSSGGPATEQFLDLVGRIKNFAVGLLIALSTLFILYAGFLYVTAGAEPKHVSQAKDIITYAVIGIVVALLSQVIVGTVTYVLTGHF